MWILDFMNHLQVAGDQQTESRRLCILDKAISKARTHRTAFAVASEQAIELGDMDEYNRQDNDQGDSHEPLIARENGSTTQERGNRQWNDNGRTVGARSGTGRSLWMLTLSAGISGLLFGYE